MTVVTSSKFLTLSNSISCWWAMRNSVTHFYTLQCQIISSCKRARIKNFAAVIAHKINHDHTIGQNRISVHIDIPSSLPRCLLGNSDVIKSTPRILQIFGTLFLFYAAARNLYQLHVRLLQLHIDRHAASLVRDHFIAST